MAIPQWPTRPPARLLAGAVALAVDRLVGEPPAALHPVAGFGRLMATAERWTYRDGRAAGVAHAALGVGIGVAAGLALERSCGWTGSTAACTVAVAGRMLGGCARRVHDALIAGDLQAARALLPALVGRDPADLDEAGVARAVVESVAENTVDAVVAPVLWAAAGGAPGVLAHRAVNTLDAMVGHRSPRYERFGWASARLDDVAAFVPARVAALTVAAVRPRRAAAIRRAVREQAGAHPSPNGGVVEAAFAAALGIRLGGVNRYAGRLEERPTLGWGPAACPADIGRAVDLLDDVTAALAVALAAFALVGRGVGGGGSSVGRGEAAAGRVRCRPVG